MKLKLSRALYATTALAGGLLLANAALAQSTATQVQEVVVTGRGAPPSVNGLGQQVEVAKDESVVNQQFFKTQVGSSNFAQLINLLPGVNYASEDPTGILSGDFRMHGFDCNHLSVTIDGSPVNDTGNYACYPGEYLVSELTDHVKVDIGATDVDSPTASAVGGTVNIVSKVPPESFGAIASISGGSYDYMRGYAELDTGALGPTGLRSYFAVNYADANKWKGDGEVKRTGFDARFYQPLKGRDFISLAASYVKNRPDFYYSASRTQLNQFGWDFDYNRDWIPETVRPGVADTVPGYPSTPAAGATTRNPAGSDTNYWGLHPNPTDFGSIRGQSLFSLTDKLTLTIDPSFFYTLANGGGAAGVSECDLRLKGAANRCVDLNGDGDTLDTVALYQPSNTKTRRYIVTSSLLYDLNEDNHIQLAYTYDYGRHRQTGEYTGVNPGTGQPEDVMGGKDGYGTPILTADGRVLQNRDRFSRAKLSQFAVNYMGAFFDNRLHINVGVRDPHFERDLNQFCYTYNGTSAYCTAANPAAILAAYNAGVAAHNTTALAAYVPGVTYNASTGTPNFRFPFTGNVHYKKVLPNAGVSYRITDENQVYASMSKGFSAPKTDDLYLSSEADVVQPESSWTYSAGYRYQTHMLTASLNGYDTEYHNRIVQSVDPDDPTLSIDRNVGNVRIYGVDLEAGLRPIEHLSLYASATLQHSEIKDNYFVNLSGHSIAIPTAGQQFVMTPEREFAGRVQYDVGNLTLGLDGKYTSARYISDTNDDRIPAYAVFNFDAEYKLPGWEDTSVRVNVANLLDRKYISRASTVTTAYAVATPFGNYSPGTPFLYVGAPRTVYVTVRTSF